MKLFLAVGVTAWMPNGIDAIALLNRIMGTCCIGATPLSWPLATM